MYGEAAVWGREEQKMTKRHIILCIVLWLCVGAHAQTFTTGGVFGAEYELKILKGWHFTAEGELRFDYNFTHYNRAKLSVGTDYTFWKKRMKIGASYSFLNYHDREDQLFDNRHRVKAFVSLAPKFGQWKVGWRVMAQTTFRDERRGDYTFNPKTYLRNRLSVSYAIPQTSLKLHLSEEFWWRLYKPGDNIVDQLRSVAGLEYSIDRHHTLDFYLRSDNEIQVKNPENVLYFGIAYSFR